MKRTAQERRAFVEMRSEKMKAEPTPAEAKMWEILEPLSFLRQFPVIGATKNGGTWQYIADFYHPFLRLVVEVDGGVHARTKGRDRRRDARLKAEGITTLRVQNKAVLMYPGDTEDFIRRHMIMAGI